MKTDYYIALDLIDSEGKSFNIEDVKDFLVLIFTNGSTYIEPTKFNGNTVAVNYEDLLSLPSGVIAYLYSYYTDDNNFTDKQYNLSLLKYTDLYWSNPNEIDIDDVTKKIIESNEAAKSANEAADAANKASENANAAANSANAAVSNINSLITDVLTATDNANNAATLANSAAKEATDVANTAKALQETNNTAITTNTTNIAANAKAISDEVTRAKSVERTNATNIATNTLAISKINSNPVLFASTKDVVITYDDDTTETKTIYLKG